MIKAAVFDLDHTLFDRYGTMAKIMPVFYEKFDFSEGMTLEKVTELMIKADKLYNHDGWDVALDFLVKEGMFKEPPTFEYYRDSLLAAFRTDAVEYPFTKPMLDKLHAMGLKTGLITNGKSITQRSKIDRLGLESYLDEIVISGEIGIGKPNPEPFKIMAKRLNMKPEEIIYVGDHPENDVDGSRGVGFIPVWVATLGRWTLPEIEKPNFSVNNVSEVPQIVEAINSGKDKLLLAKF